MSNEQHLEDEAAEQAEITEQQSSTEEQASGAGENDEHSPEASGALLEDARARADEHWNELLRSRADMENLRRRAERDVENAHKFALEKFSQELLPVVDSLELGIAAVNGDGDELQKLLEGMELTLKMLLSTLEKFGIKQLVPVGEKFDPERHQAMSMQESAEHEPNTVMAVMQKGYVLNDRLVRPAMVVVAKAATAPTGENLDEQA